VIQEGSLKNVREGGEELQDATFPSANPALYRVSRASLPIVGHHQLGTLQQQAQKGIMLAANCTRLAEVEAVTHAELRYGMGIFFPCMRKPIMSAPNSSTLSALRNRG